MSPSAVPARITIDFRKSLDPGRGWILGVDKSPRRVELLAFETATSEAAHTEVADPLSLTVVAEAGCTCPDFCERDHDVD